MYVRKEGKISVIAKGALTSLVILASPTSVILAVPSLDSRMLWLLRSKWTTL